MCEIHVNMSIFFPGKPNVKPGPKAVSAELLLYYDNITKAILGCDEELTKVRGTQNTPSPKIHHRFKFTRSVN